MAMFSSWLHRVSFGAAIALGLANLFLAADGWQASAQAQAQAPQSIEFRSAHEPYGQWRQHWRWGEVWVPARRARDWRPYQNGRWVYTDDWGWYWVSDQTEDEWGWIAFHYGRWVADHEHGWIWVPGAEWGPAWVHWRRGGEFVGWAPLPPDEIIVNTREEPDIWLFVRAGDLIAPRARNVVLSAQRRAVVMRETVVENRTLAVEKSGVRIAVNPGIAPGYIAAAARRPLPAYQVRPRVLAGTRGVESGVEVSIADIRGPGRRRDRERLRETVPRASATVIPPASAVPPPQPLRPDEKGRLGENPPRAAFGATPPAAPTVQPPSAPAAAAEQSRPSAVPAEQAPSSAPTIPEQRRETEPKAPAATPAPAAPGAAPAPAATAAPGPLREQRRPATEQPAPQQPGAPPEPRREQRRPAAEQAPRAQPGPAPPPAAHPTPPITQPPAPPPPAQPRVTPPPAREAPPAPRATPSLAPAPRPAPAPAAPPAARPPSPAQAAPPAPASPPRLPAARPAPPPKTEEQKDDKEKTTPRL